MSRLDLDPKLLRAALLLAAIPFTAPAAWGQLLVDNPFSTGFEGWTDVNGTEGIGPPANWGVLLTDGQPLIESSDGRVGVSEDQDGLYRPFILINNDHTLSGNYTITATLGTVDDDGMGIVFGYVDDNNYFRYAMRSQTNGALGVPYGNSIQKVVDGQITPLYFDGFADHGPDGVPITVSIKVEGQTITLTTDGFDHPSLSDNQLQPGKYGVHSWFQKQANSTSRQYGSMFHEISISGSLNHTTNFDDAVVSKWRRLDMVDGSGMSGTVNSEGATVGEFYGNFRQDFRNGTIVDDSNGHKYGTDFDGSGYTKIDFTGPAVVIDEPGNSSWSDYVMATRLMTNDNDGIGVVFRVAGDNSSFYRINFINESSYDIDSGRPPRGMSMQKFDNGTWSEIYSEDDSPLFVYTPGVAFDVSVVAQGNSFKVGIINDPEGALTAINYDPIVDSDNPLLTGSVGLANWGSGDNGFGAVYSAYGNGSASFLSATLPELALTIDRSTGSVILENNGADLAIDYYELTSVANSLNATIGTGTNQWTTLDLAEADGPGEGWEPAGGANAGSIGEGRLFDALTIAAGAEFSLGEAYNSVVNAEDIRFRYRLDNGMFILGDVNYIGVAPEGLAGDFNNDGIVDAADYTIWRNNLGSPEAVLGGNGDKSGVVDTGDYDLWKGNFGKSSPADLVVAQAVPEPGTWALASLGALAILWRRGRQSFLLSRNSSEGIGRPMMPKSLGVAVVFALLVSMISTPAQAVLVASYEFEGNLNDSSGNGHTGVFVGTTSIVNDPMRGQVLNIPQTGNQGVNINTINPIPQFAANSSITLMAWYKRDAVTPITGDYRYVVDLGQNGNNPIASLGIRINGRIASYIETDEPTPNGDQVDVIGQTAVEGNAAQWAGWHHLAVVHDRSDDLARVYLDGVLDQEVSISDVRDDYAFTWTGANIGRGPEGASSIAYGLIDDVKIYSHALSLEEVRAAAGITIVEGTINRDTGLLTLTNIGGTAAKIAGYSLSSPSGALDVANWQSVTGNYDNGGPGAIDTDPWSIDSATNELLSESETPAINGGTLGVGESVQLGTAWIKTPNEDVTLRVVFRNGLTSNFPVVFEGGINGAPYLSSDLNFDGTIDLADWNLFAPNLMSDQSSISSDALRYPLGDLNGDGLNDASDFAIFKREYEAANGAGSFAAAIAAQPVPEPATVACGLLVASSALLLRRRRSRSLEG